MTIRRLLEHSKLLMDVLRVTKVGLDSFVFTTDEPGKVFVINSEGSVIYVVSIPANSQGWIPNRMHIAGAVKNYNKIMSELEDSKKDGESPFDNIIFTTYNQWLYPTTLHAHWVTCLAWLNSLRAKMPSFRDNMVVESEDILTDPYYEFIFTDVFSKGTGVGDIVKTKSGRPITVYKGLLPYTSKDKIKLTTGDIGSREFITCYTISKIKPTASSMSVDMYTRCLDIFAPQHLSN